MAMVEELRNLLEDLKNRTGAEICAIISRNGIPIVFTGIDGGQVDTFSTLSATILGASEVIYSGLGKEKPNTVVAESDGGVFLATPLSAKTLLTILGKADKDKLLTAVEGSRESIREVLSHGG